jgi:hypothetical protein
MWPTLGWGWVLLKRTGRFRRKLLVRGVHAHRGGGGLHGPQPRRSGAEASGSIFAASEGTARAVWSVELHPARREECFRPCTDQASRAGEAVQQLKTTGLC